MRIVAVAFAATLFAAPVAAQDDFTDPWGWDEPYQSPPGYQDPYLSADRRLRQMDEAIEQEYENTREYNRLAGCASIWHNPAGAEECRRRAGY